MTRALYFLARVAFVLTFAASTARAGQGRVLLVPVSPDAGGWTAAEQRVAAEFEALGVEVSSGPEGLLEPCADDRITRDAIVRAGALAAIELRMRPGPPPMLRICVVDVVTGKATARHWPGSAAPAIDQVALMAVEILHASLLELKVQYAPRGELAPPKVVHDRLIPRPRVILGVRAGLAAWGEPGSVYGGGADFGLWLPFGGNVGIDAAVLLGLASGEVTSQTASASVFPGMLRSHAVLEVPGRGPLSFRVGLGGGLLAAQVVGHAEVPYRATEGVASTWLASALLGSSVRLSDAWRVRFDAHVGWTPQPLEIEILGEVAARLGQPLLDGTLSVEWLVSSE